MINVLLVSLFLWQFALVFVLLPLFIKTAMLGAPFPPWKDIMRWSGWLGVGFALLMIGNAL